MLAVVIDSWIPFVFWYVLWNTVLPATSVLLLVVLQREMEEHTKTSEMGTG